MLFGRNKTTMIEPEKALPGRAQPAFEIPANHAVLDTPIQPPFPAGLETAIFGLGCFWGAERIFWQADGVYTTAVGYSGGFTPNPTYEEVCTGRTGHAEVVQVAFDPTKVSYEELLKHFWELHDPTQGMRQGNDVGTQYRSIILVANADQRRLAEASLAMFQEQLTAAGYGKVTTEIQDLDHFYYAEDYHQQYLVQNPFGYCPDHRTGVRFPDVKITPLQYVD